MNTIEALDYKFRGGLISFQDLLMCPGMEGGELLEGRGINLNQLVHRVILKHRGDCLDLTTLKKC